MGRERVPTHELIYRGSVVTKRFTSWARGEHRREWTMLTHLQQHAPGLAAQPVTADLHAQPPEVVMTVVPGQALHGALGADQLAGLTLALKTLWAVPTEDLPTEFAWADDLRFARLLTDGQPPVGDVLAQAYQEAVRWWEGPDPARLRTPPCTLLLANAMRISLTTSGMAPG